MRILCDLHTAGHLRFFDSTLDQLGARGHAVSLTVDRPDLYPNALERLAELDHPPAYLGQAPRREGELMPLARGLRAALDYVRYLDPRFAEAGFLRSRAREKALRYGPFSRPFGSIRRLRPWQVAVLMRALTAVERAIPGSPAVEAFVRSLDPDLVVVSPFLTTGTPQVDYVKSAQALGIPTAVCVASWDNLTNKGQMRLIPDRVMVWNDAQRREAVELHDVPSDRLAVTGAQVFDRWFGRAPSASRAEFCAEAGLPPDRPFVLFCASRSNIGAGVEQRFVERWVAAIRGWEGPPLGVLVRPHPERPESWDGVLDDWPDAVVWPTSFHSPVAEATRTDFFDSLFHSAAVVGTNTSAMIEAAIVGRPVLTVRAPEFEQSQRGTLHFRYLQPKYGGFVREAWGLDEHLAQLTDAIARPEQVRAANRRFVEEFIRPRGVDRPCVPILVDELERLGAAGRAAPSHSSARAVVDRLYARAGALALVRVARWTARRRSRRRPQAVMQRARRRAQRARRVLGGVAKRAPRHTRRRIAASRGAVVAGLRARGRRQAQRQQRREAAQAAAHGAVIERGRRLLDPEPEAGPRP